MRTIGDEALRVGGRRRVLVLFTVLLLFAAPLRAQGADFWRLWPPATLPEASVAFPAPPVDEPSLSVGIGTPARFILHGRAAIPSSAPEAGIFLHRALGGRGCFDFALGIARPGAVEGSLPMPDLRTFLRVGIIF